MRENVFDSMIQEAEALGVPARPVSTSELTSNLVRACALVRLHESLYQCKLQEFEQSDYVAWDRLCQQQALSERQSTLASAVATLRTILDSKETIGRRLREASMGSTITVQPVLQPHLSGLLEAACTGAGALQEGMDALEWALSFNERPSCWEDKLQGITDALKAAQLQQSAMQQLSQALASQADGKPAPLPCASLEGPVR